MKTNPRTLLTLAYPLLLAATLLLASLGWLLLRNTPPAHAAQGDFVWAGALGGPNPDRGQEIAVDDAGNVYIIGFFEGTADFDPSLTATFPLTSSGGYDIFVTKLDQNGNFVWAKQMGGSSNWDMGTAIALDDAGNIYTTGYFEGTADFDPDLIATFPLTSTGSLDVFVSKLDTDGNFLWAKQMGGTGFDYGQKITLDDAGNIYTIGYFEGTADFDPDLIATFPLTSSGSGDIFVSKLDNNGSFVWAKQLGGGSDDYGEAIALDDTGNVYTTGTFSGTADFDPGPGTFPLTSAVSYDIFVSKLDTDGNFLWARRMGGSSFDLGWAIALDDAANVYTTGYFSGTADFDPGPLTHTLTSSSGNDDIFISKLDTDGNFVWAKQMGGDGWADEGSAIVLDDAGNIYTTGIFNGVADFDPGPLTHTLTSVGAWDIFVSKLSSNGTFIWAKQMGGNDVGARTATVLDDAGNIYTTGIFSGAADFDPGPLTHTLTSAGDFDGFVVKLAGGEDDNDLWITKAVTPTGTITAGQWVTYTLTYSNAGTELAQNVVITDLIPALLTNASAITSGTPLAQTSGVTYEWHIEELGAGEGGVITITGLVDPTLLEETILLNTAQITATDDLTPTNNSASATLTVSPIYTATDLGLTKSAAPTGLITAGETIIYTLAFSNSGPAVARNVLITDIIPTTLLSLGLSNSGVVLTRTSGVIYGWQVEDLSPGEGGIITITGVINPDLLQDMTLTNTAQITGTNDLTPANNTDAVASTLRPAIYTIYLPLVYKPVLYNETVSSFYNLGQINVEQAWTSSMGDGVVVAVLDTGANTNHPDLAGNLVAGRNVINGTSNIYDGHGHGSHVAGIVAAVANNGGLIGVAPKAKIMPVKVLNDEGTGTIANLTDGIIWAANNGADVINMSLRGPSYTLSEEDAIIYAYDRGVLLLAAGGNCGDGNYAANGCGYQDQPSYPAAFAQVMAVASTDQNDDQSSFSNQNSYIEIAAPGSFITSAAAEANGSDCIFGSVVVRCYTASGTSQASPHVAGVAALIWAKYPSLTAEQVRTQIINTSVDLGAVGWDNIFGYGRVDAEAAVGALNLASVAAPGKSSPLPSAPADAPFVAGQVLVKLKPGVTLSSLLADNAGLSGFSLQSLKRIGPLNLELVSVPSGQEQAFIAQALAAEGVEYAELNYIIYAQ